MATYTPILLDEAFPVAEPPACGHECVSWGPHNVLLLATRWSVHLYTDDLRKPAGAVRLRHHPLCYRRADEAADDVVSAKWARGLVPEGRYPAEARVCVRTSGNLVVYRVARHGSAGEVVVSKGIGIGANYHPNDLAAVPGGIMPRSTEEHDAPNDSPTPQPPPRKPRVRGSRGRRAVPQPKVVKPSRKVPATRRGRGRTKRQVPSPRSESTSSERTEESASCSSSGGESEGSDSGSEADSHSSSSSSSSSSESEQRKRRRRRAAARKAAKKRPPPARAAAGKRRRQEAADEDGDGRDSNAEERSADSSLAASSAAASASLSQDARGVQRRDTTRRGVALGPRKRHVVLDCMWLPGDTLVVVTTLGVHLVPLLDDFSDDDAPQVRPLPPPSHGFADDCVGRERTALPCCAAIASVRSSAAGRMEAGGRHLLLVASPFLLRVCTLTTTTAGLLYYVDVPLLASVPSCISAVVERAWEDDVSLRPTNATASPPALQLSILVSSPSGTFRGRACLPPREPASLAGEGGAPSALAWEHLAVFSSKGFTEDPLLRGWCEFPTHHIAARATAEDAKRSGGEEAERPPSPPCESVTVAVGHRCLHGFVTRGSRSHQTTITLFRCPSLATATEVPADAAVSVCGVALHSSCALGIVAVKTGFPGRDPVHLLPFVASDPEGFVYRVLSANAAVEAEEDATPAGRAEGRAKQFSSTTQQHVRQRFLWALWKHQRRVDYFTWEPLFVRNKEEVGLRLYADAWARLHRPPPASPSAGAVAVRVPAPLLSGGEGLRELYCRVRDALGVSMFFRSPVPDLSSADSAAFADSDKAPSWSWWSALLALWQRFPWEGTPIAEMALANAVMVVAKRAGYNNAALSPGEEFLEDASPPSGGGWSSDATTTASSASVASAASSPWTYSVTGAMDYVHLYLEAQRENLLARRPREGTEVGGTRTQSRSTAVDHPQRLEHLPHIALWACSEPWVRSVEAFVKVCAPRCSFTGGCYERHRFPCSVCGCPDAAQLCARTFSCSSLHKPKGDSCASERCERREEAHTTVFSAKTFCPLSMFSQEAVLTRCVSCGLADFAAGPCCRVCGGLLQ